MSGRPHRALAALASAMALMFAMRRNRARDTVIRIVASLAAACAGAVCGVGAQSAPPRGTAQGQPAASSERWTYCTDAGAVCQFTGLREVRLIALSGAFVSQTVFGSVDCAVSGFQNRNPAPLQSLRCDYGPMKFRTLVNPTPEGMLSASAIEVPMGSPGVSVPQSRSGGSGTVTDGTGTFRTTCQVTAFEFADPVGVSGQSRGAALHVFFGNTTASDMASSAAVATSGNSACRGGTLNRSLHYLPAIVDARTGEVQMPSEDLVSYYKTGFNMDPVSIKPFPTGLVLVAGDAHATAPQRYAVEWLCRDRFVYNDGMIPDCAVGDQVQLRIHFPQCWDGTNLDSPDHHSHMAYPVYRRAPAVSACPTTHPVVLPEITQIVHYTVKAGASVANWRLATDRNSAGTRGGLSAHATWIAGWDGATQNAFISNCLNKAMDCGFDNLGNGTQLF